MSRRTSTSEYRASQLIIAAVYLFLVGLFATATASAEEEARTSSSQHYVSGGRNYVGDPETTSDAFGALVTDGERQGTARALQKDGVTATAKATVNDFWIYEADVVLFGDDDNDGHFYGIDLLFDADTIYSTAFVYGVLHLSFEGGPGMSMRLQRTFVSTEQLPAMSMSSSQSCSRDTQPEATICDRVIRRGYGRVPDRLRTRDGLEPGLPSD